MISHENRPPHPSYADPECSPRRALPHLHARRAALRDVDMLRVQHLRPARLGFDGARVVRILDDDRVPALRELGEVDRLYTSNLALNPSLAPIVAAEVPVIARTEIELAI